MPAGSYLIDGNNLMYALAESVGRAGLCKLLSPLASRGARVRVVFDGPPPPDGVAMQIDETGVEVAYSNRRKADALLLEDIAAESAPRRLTVVSSDHQIRTAARRRRCISLSSDEFARVMDELSHPRPRPPGEPFQKQRGLTEEESLRWLREFGMDGVDGADQDR